MFHVLGSPKVEKYLTAIKKEKLTIEELRELLKVIARDYQIPIRIADEADQDDFWVLSPEHGQRFNDLLDKATEDLRSKRYSEYGKPRV